MAFKRAAFLCGIFSFCLPFSDLLVSATLFPPTIITDGRSHASNESVFNTTLPGVGATVEIICSGDQFGFAPSISDCESAKEYITPDYTQYTWEYRHTGLEETIFPLPYRIMGGE